MNTAPGGDAMSVRYHRDADIARLRREPVRRPYAYYLHPAEVARFAADKKHCETRRCRNPVTVCTWRWWRSSEAGRALLSEHLVCTEHGTGFAERHHIELDPPSTREARRLTGAETASLTAEGKHCDARGCENSPTCIFTERYTVHGEPRADEDRSCDDHAGMFAARFHVTIAPAPEEDPR